MLKLAAEGVHFEDKSANESKGQPVGSFREKKNYGAGNEMTTDNEAGAKHPAMLRRTTAPPRSDDRVLMIEG